MHEPIEHLGRLENLRETADEESELVDAHRALAHVARHSLDLLLKLGGFAHHRRVVRLDSRAHRKLHRLLLGAKVVLRAVGVEGGAHSLGQLVLVQRAVAVEVEETVGELDATLEGVRLELAQAVDELAEADGARVVEVEDSNKPVRVLVRPKPEDLDESVVHQLTVVVGGALHERVVATLERVREVASPALLLIGEERVRVVSAKRRAEILPRDVGVLAVPHAHVRTTQHVRGVITHGPTRQRDRASPRGYLPLPAPGSANL